MKDWDKELAKIDKQLGSLPDEALLPAPAPSQKGRAAAAPALPDAGGKRSGLWLRVGLVAALGVGMVFWPYAARCGTGLMLYLGALGVLAGSGLWAAAAAWRHRAGRLHALSLLLALWGGVLAAREVLPRVGYAIPSEAHPAVWGC